ncbi:radical SAM family heme chaperone HemW [Leptothermofonsia sp. ETS-13]|uniref:radical SAM family heme chaperone HemW n=1 Tax=Leptothermofonsia sp. ETS-13 TaxID=3035696 RepID=UPI003BA0BC76
MLLAKEYAGQAVYPFEAPTSAYVHIPFCRRRCFYCDFPISVVGDKPLIKKKSGTREQGKAAIQDRINGSNSGTIAHYVEVLCQEIGRTPSQGHVLETVFLGGGTPSLLSVEQLNQILHALDQQFGIAADAEISMEIDPATFDLEQVRGYRLAGVNRVSLGVQAFQPELLTASGRSHTVEDIVRAIELIHQAGFQNISLDLISGLPHQTLNHWQESLERAIALSPTHLSCYDLTIEAGTPFSRQYKPGVAPLPSDKTTADMYRLAQKTLTAAGFDHYEISNYAKPGYQCRHNRVYWENRPFYGFGMGATSYVGGDRFARPRKIQEYYTWLEEIQTALTNEINPFPSLVPLSSCDLLLDTLMLGLRLAEGLSLLTLSQKFGQETVERIWNRLQPYYQKGWVEVQERPEAIAPDGTFPPVTGRIKLTDPEGFLFSNVILSALFEEFS